MVTGGWRIDRNGAFDFDPVLDAFLSGRGTRTLTAKGVPITIDATAEGPGTFQITTVLGLDSVSRAVPQTLSLLPSVAHRFLSDKHSFVFSVPLRSSTCPSKRWGRRSTRSSTRARSSGSDVAQREIAARDVRSAASIAARVFASLASLASRASARS
jgi:hypothetical protein